ncbi:helix-turn-helix domain-containing protein [Kitasatospora sp. NPDC048194]|uniref:helix-turn-helix domain-containing protein n=1 Tax=Kitasatospora sp. NPDC048194 TaxID=3364045 RepID=UPI0037107B43
MTTQPAITRSGPVADRLEECSVNAERVHAELAARATRGDGLDLMPVIKDLADTLGLTRRMVTDALQDLTEAGLLTTRRVYALETDRLGE